MKSFIKAVAISCLTLVMLASTKVLADQPQVPLPKGQWQSILNDGSGNDIFLDRGSLARQGDIAAFWLKLNQASSNNVAKMYYALNCSTGAALPLWAVAADKQGHILRSFKMNQPATITPPGSSGWLVLNIVCGNQDPAVQAQAAQAQIVQAQLETLTRAHQTNADLINSAMNTSASMFK